MGKQKKESQKPTSFRLGPEILEALNEVVRPDCPLDYGIGRSKAKWLEAGLSYLFFVSLMGKICIKQITTCKDDRELCKLFVMFCRAQRGMASYGFTAKRKSARFVYGPGAEFWKGMSSRDSLRVIRVKLKKVKK